MATSHMGHAIKREGHAFQPALSSFLPDVTSVLVIALVLAPVLIQAQGANVFNSDLIGTMPHVLVLVDVTPQSDVLQYS